MQDVHTGKLWEEEEEAEGGHVNSELCSILF